MPCPEGPGFVLTAGYPEKASLAESSLLCFWATLAAITNVADNPVCQSSRPGLALTGCYQGVIFKLPGGNPLGPGHAGGGGVGAQAELRAAYVADHPDWKHFSISVGKAVSMLVHGSSVWGSPPAGPLPLPPHDSAFKAPDRKGSQPHAVTTAQARGRQHSHAGATRYTGSGPAAPL